jgi:hypothetical protein
MSLPVLTDIRDFKAQNIPRYKGTYCFTIEVSGKKILGRHNSL